MIDKHTVVVQKHFKQNKTINANANFENAVGQMTNALTGFNIFETIQEGELVTV